MIRNEIMTQTKNFNLDLPPYGTPDWHIFVNLNFKKIDEFANANLKYNLQAIAGEDGTHGLRYWKGKLEYLLTDNDGNSVWTPILISGGGGSGQTGTEESSSIIVSSTMPNQYFGEFWYEVDSGKAEEGGIRLEGDKAKGRVVIVSDAQPSEAGNYLWLDPEDVHN